MPGYGEGFGIVDLEALACGVPVLASTLDASREALLDGEMGLLVDPRNREELHSGLVRLLQQPRGQIPPGLERFSYPILCGAAIRSWTGCVRGAMLLRRTEMEGKPLRTRRRLIWLAGLFGVAAIAVLLRVPLLNGAARAWMVNDPPAKADAIVVLGGGANFRSFAAGRLYHSGWAPTIVVMNSELRATDRLGLTIPEAELVRRILLSNAVPAEAIQILGTNLTSTHDEALTLKQWSQDSHAASFLIPTGPFHARRVRWVFRKVFRDAPARLTVTTIDPNECQGWWRHEKVLMDFQNEVVKFAYYLVRY